MIKLGILGLNEGNGHPFSYSAIFNGYDPDELQKRCPFSLIKEYLPKEHCNKLFVENAKVTHVWTQDPKLSEDVSRVSLIPNIVSHYIDMIGAVDGVILARDDPWNHLEMAKPFVEKGIPIFIDKQLTSTRDDLEKLISLTGENYPLMACSPMRYTRDVLNARQRPEIQKVKSIHGISRVSWMRYGHHLFEGIAVIWGLDIDSVRSLSQKEDHDIVQIRYKSGMNVILEFIKEVSLPIQFTCFSEYSEPFMVPFSDFFHSFREMMLNFTAMVESGKRPIPFEEIVKIAQIVLAGDISKKSGGIEISPLPLNPL